MEYYPKDALVFKKDRIGVITSGQIMFCKHPNSCDGNPVIVKRAYEGDIIGFIEGDNGLTNNPLTWYITITDHTEVIFLQVEQFMSLWRLQHKMTEH